MADRYPNIQKERRMKLKGGTAFVNIFKGFGVTHMFGLPGDSLALYDALYRGGGYLLNTCSGAGLLANADAPYMVTKHAAVAFADWLAIKYRARLRVQGVCH